MPPLQIVTEGRPQRSAVDVRAIRARHTADGRRAAAIDNVQERLEAFECFIAALVTRHHKVRIADRRHHAENIVDAVIALTAVKVQ